MEWWKTAEIPIVFWQLGKANEICISDLISMEINVVAFISVFVLAFVRQYTAEQLFIVSQLLT